MKTAESSLQSRNLQSRDKPRAPRLRLSSGSSPTLPAGSALPLNSSPLSQRGALPKARVRWKNPSPLPAASSSASFSLKIGDRAFCPGQGVGRVTAIESKNILGSPLTCYSIEILKSGTKLMIPAGRLKSAGVRPLIAKKDAGRVLSILSSRADPKALAHIREKNWQKRSQVYLDKIKTGSIYEIAEAVRDLSRLQKNKTLSYGEKRLLDKAQKMVYSELSFAMDKKDFQKAFSSPPTDD